MCYSSSSLAPSYFSSPQSWCRIGRLETKESADAAWSADGQCVVIDDSLIITAAHVCFYDQNENKRKIQKDRIIQEIINQRNVSSSSSSSSSSSTTTSTSSKFPFFDSDIAIRQYASSQSLSKIPPSYVQFPFLQAVFHEPVYSKESQSHISVPIDSKKWCFDCELIRASGSMDVAVLRIVSSANSGNNNQQSSSSSTPCPRPYPFKKFFSSSSLCTGLDVTLIVYQKEFDSPLESEGKIEHLKMKEKKTGSQGHFLIALANYTKQSGYSGGAVVSWDKTIKDWMLVGIHTGTEYKEYAEEEELNITQSDHNLEAEIENTNTQNKPSLISPSDPPNTRSRSRSAISDQTDSYDPSTDITPELSQTSIGPATTHAQTNSSLATFVGIHSILTRDHWNVRYLKDVKKKNVSPFKKLKSGRQTRRVDIDMVPISMLNLYDIDG
jgi:hypothetical protein